jgi:hypothetical protein
MTNVTVTQAPYAPWSRDLDPIDLLVPPARSFRRALLLTLFTAIVLFAVAFAGGSGLLWPKLGLGLDASYAAASSTTRPSMTFNLQNNGRLPLSIVGADARAPGLVGARVTVARLGTGGAMESAHAFPLAIAGGHEVHITMTFARWRCSEIKLHGSDTVPIHLSDPLGLNTTVSVVPGYHFDPPSTGVLIGSSDPNEIGWAAGITWMSCHPGTGAPNMGVPTP